MTMFRLCDGSDPSDWFPRHGDRPCVLAPNHEGHPLDGCPLLFSEPESD